MSAQTIEQINPDHVVDWDELELDASEQQDCPVCGRLYGRPPHDFDKYTDEEKDGGLPYLRCECGAILRRVMPLIKTSEPAWQFRVIQDREATVTYRFDR